MLPASHQAFQLRDSCLHSEIVQRLREISSGSLAVFLRELQLDLTTCLAFALPTPVSSAWRRTSSM